MIAEEKRLRLLVCGKLNAAMEDVSKGAIVTARELVNEARRMLDRLEEEYGGGP